MDAKFFKNRDNEVSLELSQDGAVIDHTQVTKLELVWSGGVVSSATNPELFVFAAGSIKLKLGLSDLAVGVYSMDIVAYSADHPNGILWFEDACIHVE